MSTDVNIPNNYTITLKGDPAQPLDTNSVITLEPPDDGFNFNITSTGQQTITVDKPIVTDSTNAITLDVKPVAVDLCAEIKLGKLPPTRIRQPSHTHFGITLFGIELFGMNIAGESQIIMEDYNPSPRVLWGGEEQRPRKQHTQHQIHHDTGGIRIRLKD